MQNLKLEKLQEKHIKQIFEIEKETFSDFWSENMLKEELKNPLANYIILSLEDEIVAYAGYWHILEDAQIMKVAVKKSHRGKGYSDKIMQDMIKQCKDKNIETMSLEVRVSNKVAINLYEKYGFEIHSRRKEYYQDNKEDAYIMWKFFKV